MAVEGLTLTPPTGSPINLNGTKWVLEALDLGSPGRREELISSIDAHGSVPARASMRDVREVNLRLRLQDAASKDAALSSIAALEVILESAEALAAEGPTDPVAGLVRLVYTPADSSSSFSLLVLRGEIEVPKTMDSEDFGWTINFPVVNVKCVCDPFAYGALRTYLDTTTSAGIAPSVTVAGGPGDVPPWTRLAIKDVAATQRSLLRLGVKRGEASTSAPILASGWTAVNGTLSGGYMGTTSLDIDNWQVLAQIPRQTRIGSFRIYGHQVSRLSTAPTDGQMRLAWREAGGSLRRGPVVTIDASGTRDSFLGEVSVGGPWDAWIETKGAASVFALLPIPTDSFVEVTGPNEGASMVGAFAAEDALQTTSTHIGGRTLTTGGTWTTGAASPTWPVSAANWARRTAVSMASPVFAQAGTGNHMEVQVQATVVPPTTLAPRSNGLGVAHGVFARFVDTSNYLVFGIDSSTTVDLFPSLVAVVGGSAFTFWRGARLGIANGPVATPPIVLTLQTTSDGRWSVTVESGIFNTYQAEIGQSGVLASGGTLGNASAAKGGLFDFHTTAGAAIRDTKDFSIRALAGVTPAPVPSGATLRLAGPEMYNSDLADYPYIGSSGLTFSPGVNNNLTVVGQRMAGIHGTSADTAALDLNIAGYPRFTTIPHT
jgi:hypothetical protein